MKVCIRTGKALERPRDRGLVEVFHDAETVIEASTEVRRLERNGDLRCLLAGHVVGAYARNGASATISSEGVMARAVTTPLAQCQQDFEGRFLLVVRRDDGTIEVSADRFGAFDVYYRIAADGVQLATDLDALATPAAPGSYDQAALAHTVTVYGNRPPKPRTLYEDIHRLPVGSVARLNGRALTIEATPWQPVPTAAYRDADLERYASTLMDAVEMRGSRHGNVVYLSSGWDSTSLLACLVKIFGARGVRAVIGRMQYSHRSGVINQFELDRARAVADYYGVRLDVAELDYRGRAAPETLERLRGHFRAHQYTNMTALNHGLLAEFVARTTTGDEAVFAGEISDGAHNLGFSQFVTIFHPSLAFREYSDKMGSYLFGPTFLQEFLSGRYERDAVYTLFRARAGEATFDAAAQDPTARRRQLLASLLLRPSRIPLYSLANVRVLTPRGRALYEAEIEGPLLGEAAADLTPETLYAWYLRLYNSFHWQGSTVSPILTTAESLGLRMELPFWDSRLQAFLSAMPEHWGRGLDLNPTKYPLKWMLRERIDYPMHLQVGPHSYLYDVDPSFSHYAELLYSSGFTTYFKERLTPRGYRSLLSPEIFDFAYLDAAVDRYLGGVEVRGSEMNEVLTLALLASIGWYGAS